MKTRYLQQRRKEKETEICQHYIKPKRYSRIRKVWKRTVTPERNMPMKKEGDLHGNENNAVHHTVALRRIGAKQRGNEIFDTKRMQCRLNMTPQICKKGRAQRTNWNKVRVAGHGKRCCARYNTCWVLGELILLAHSFNGSNARKGTHKWLEKQHSRH